MIFFFSKRLNFSKNLSEIPSMSNSLDPDKTACFVGPDLSQKMFRTNLELASKEEIQHSIKIPCVRYVPPLQ